MKQRTIQKSAHARGIGLHTGKIVNITFLPAAEGHGYKFKRVDLDGAPVIGADVAKVVSTNRGTVIKSGDAQVSTIEHVLSALVGLQIDNILIEIDGPEVPIIDGSARHFVALLEEAGIEEQEATREYFEIDEVITYKDPSGAEYVAMPADAYQVTALIDFNSDVLGQQFASLERLEDYITEIAPCRTFVFLHELELLVNQGLIKGGDLDNAVVIADRLPTEAALADLAKKLGKPTMKIDRQGILNTTDLRFKNEPARHKVLDIVGDLALVGKPIKGKIVATKPGHTANIEFAKILRKQYIEQRRHHGFPKYDPNKEPLKTTMEIARMLPHRYPFLLVDKVIEMSETHIVSVKNITFNEAFFQGHFPNNPIFPGVLQMEALAQTGGILALSNVPDPWNWDTYFVKIDNARFKQKVVPGDTLLLKMELMAPIRRGLIQMQATAYVGNKIASEAELTAQIVRRNTTNES